MKREIVSFDGVCPYGCLHCYTFTNGFVSKGKANINEIILDLKNKDFDVVYVSGFRENFYNPYDGIKLTEEIYREYCCDILITTRNVFSEAQIQRLANLDEIMKQNNNYLFACVSISALDSYKKLESNEIIPKPPERIMFLKRLHEQGIITFLTVRPLCPNDFIPTVELLKLIDECYMSSTAVISSGIMLDDNVERRLKKFPVNVEYEKTTLTEALGNNIEIKHINVKEELMLLRQHCLKLNVPFFEDSESAIVFVKK